MIKRRFFKIDHGDRDGSGNSSSSSDEDYDNHEVAQVSDDNDDNNDSDDEASSASSGYKSEDSPANDIDANSIDANSAGLLSSEDDAGTINEREMITNKEFPSERNYEKSNVMAEKKPLPSDIPSSLVLQIKSIFKCRLCPRVICLTEDTLRNHLQSKRHARSEKLHEKGRLKAMLNSDGEIEDQEVSDNEAEDAEKNGKGSKPFKKRFKKNKVAAEMQTEDTEDNTKKNGKGPKPYKKRFKKNEEVAEIQTEDTEDNTKKNDNGPKLHKKRSGKKELNIGGSLVTTALEEACGTNRLKIREMYNKLGDLGDVAQECRQTQRLLAPPTPLLIKDIYSALRKISVQTGNGSTLRKKGIILHLMRSCREKEMKFLVRTLVRNLRIGAMLRTVLPALAHAVVMNSLPTVCQEGTAEKLKAALQVLSVEVVEAYNILPNLDIIVPSLMNKGIEFSVSSLSMVPGIPIKPMLAKITNGIPQAVKLFQNKAFTCEYKYDGQRAQIHKLVDGSVLVFSRNGDESTSRFPDLVDMIKESCKPVASTFIIDAEVVGIDRKNGCRIMSFQELSSRGRGGKDTLVTKESIKVGICIFVFDIMFANGEQLLGFPLRLRRKYLKDLFNDERPGYFEYAKETSIEADDACLTCEATLTRINAFLEDALHSSCEGIMVKTLDIDAGYSPSKRSDKWLKVKRDYVEGLNDTLDLVPIGAWHGNGRKAGWYSPFLMACFNPETEEYQSVCRVMSGFTDSFYIEMKEFFSEDKLLSKKPPYYQTGETPDMWFCPQLVWEIRGADFTVSPVHHAAIGLVHPSRGISIRFPRFICRVSDRNPDECSTAADIVEMFHSQTRKMDVPTEG